ncbi:MAG: PorT family protein [Bacteroidales bacterium]|nr:PorT family protein [Bacteroidales bacterium]
MKRLFALLAFCVLMFSGAQNLFAGDFGIVGGAGFTGMKEVSSGLATGYHAGLTYKFRLPLGFAIQPSLLYQMKASSIEGVVEGQSSFDYRMGYLELPVSFQWGPDLLLFRPFLDVAPYVGYGLNNRVTGLSVSGSDVSFRNRWDGISRLEYGLGLGVGLEIWKIQVIGRYNWNFGPLFDGDGNAPGASEIWSLAKESVMKGKNFSGVTLSVAFLF